MADVSAAFVNQYEAEVHVAYQQGGSRLRNTVRVKSGIVGASTSFTKIGKGKATQKTRNGSVVAMNVDHSQVKALLEDWYAPDYVDKLDEYKINHDERKVLTQSGGAAVGRKVDELIMNAAITGLPAGRIIGTGAALITLDDCLEAFALLNEGDVPDDGQRYSIVGPRQWNALLKIDQFAKSDYVGNEFIWAKGIEAKRWLNTVWLMHTGLPTTGTGATLATKCLMYHRTALGLAEGASGVTAEVNYVAEKVAHLCNNMISAGAVAIDTAGIVCLHCKNK